MKLLKTSFFLAAAAAAQLDATDYIATWNLTNGNSAKVIFGVNPSFSFNPSGLNQFYSSSDFSRFDISVVDQSQNVVWSANKSAFIYMRWNPSGKNLGTNGTHVFYAGYNDFFINASSGQFQIGYMNGVIGVIHTPAGDNFYNPFFIDSFGPAFSGVTDVPAWMSSISGANQTYATGVNLSNLPLEGAHHRPMLSYDRMGKDNQAWATGDFGSSSRTRDAHVTTGEAGLNWNAGQNGLFGFALGHGEQNADLAFSGSSATKGDYALAEFDYRPGGSQWVVSLLGMVGSWESKINRGYTSGGSSDFSYGVADLITRSARLRVDAPSLATFGGFGFAPYASYTVTQTVVGAYTETGGGFPASFDEQTHNSIEARAGVTAAKDLDAQTKLLLTVEAIHRFDGAGPGLTGQDVTGGVAFSLPGTAPRNNYVRFGFDIDRKLNENTLLNISAHTSTIGEEQDVSAAISVRRAF